MRIKFEDNLHNTIIVDATTVCAVEEAVFVGKRVPHIEIHTPSKGLFFTDGILSYFLETSYALELLDRLFDSGRIDLRYHGRLWNASDWEMNLENPEMHERLNIGSR